MAKISMCRICLVEDVRMRCIADTKLQQVYETLIAKPLDPKHRPSLQVCYLCQARLWNCYKLQVNCLYSEELFTQMLENCAYKPTSLPNMNTLQIILPPVIQLSFGFDAPRDSSGDDGPNAHPLGTTECVVVKEEQVVEAENANVTDEVYKTLGTEPQSIVKVEPDIDYLCNNIQNIKSEYDVGFEICIQTEDVPATQVWPKNILRERKLGTDQCKLDAKVTLESKKIKKASNSRLSTEKQFECDICGRRFRRKYTLLKHIHVIHAGHIRKTEIEIKYMKMKFMSKKDGSAYRLKVMKNKESLTNIKTSHKCHLCEKYFGRKYHLSRHIKNVHTVEKPHKCEWCGMYFKSQCILARHFREHNDGKPYKCPTCDKCFKSKNYLILHVRRHTGEKPYKCNLCDKRFIQKPHLDRHITYMHTAERAFKCSICEKRFSCKWYLAIHERLHVGEKPHKCNICQKSFSFQCRLKEHINYIHTDNKKYKCDQCEKSYIYKAELERHIFRHTGVKPFHCGVCGRRYVKKTNLRAHMRRHTGEATPYKCPVCGKYCSCNSELTNHIRTHTGERPFKCDICVSGFNLKGQLVVHMRTKHPEQYMH